MQTCSLPDRHACKAEGVVVAQVLFRCERQALDIVVWTFVYALVYFIFLDRLYGALQMFTFLTIPILARYHGERGRWKGMKWFFYIYYPAHLVVIGLVRLAVNGDVPIIF